LWFLARTPSACRPLVLGVSIVLASTWAHDVVYHGVNVCTFIVPLTVPVALAPLFVFTPIFVQTRRRCLLGKSIL
jgi:hypothetical protein